MTQTAPRLDIEALETAMHRGGPPSSDDVIVLRDGTRLDTPAKARAWIDEIVQARRSATQSEAQRV